MTRITTFSDDSVDALKRDHERLRYEMEQMRTMLRAFMAAETDRGLRPVCRFTLNAALTMSDASKAATITHQLGAGRKHLSTSITVQNFLTHTAGTYQYYGHSGDAGKAYYNPEDKTWHIFDMECP